MPDLSADAFSDLVGSIYDCALNAALWPVALERICESLDCVASQLFVVDPLSSHPRFAAGWNEPPEATRLLVEKYGTPVRGLLQHSLQTRGPDPDEPIVLRRLSGAEEWLRSPGQQEWAAALGYCDVIAAVVLQEPDRVGLLGASRHESIGPVTDREIALMRRLTPHLRRAVAIGNVLGMQDLKTQALAGTLDGLSVGVGIVAADGALLHANAVARRMMGAADGPIRSPGGRLAGRRAEATQELRAAIALAASGDPARMGRSGIGVALSRGAAPAVAHVLPLNGSGSRQGLLPRAAAAVFVSAPAKMDPAGELPIGVARSLELTAAEARLVGQLMAGATLAQAAAALGIAPTTAKSQLHSAFRKAGVSRQADLLALLERLDPRVRTPDGGAGPPSS